MQPQSRLLVPDASGLPGTRECPLLGTGFLQVTQACPEARRSQHEAVEESPGELPNLPSASQADSKNSQGRLRGQNCPPLLRGSCVPPPPPAPQPLNPDIYSELQPRAPPLSRPCQDGLSFRLWVPQLHGDPFCQNASLALSLWTSPVFFHMASQVSDGPGTPLFLTLTPRTPIPPGPE